MSIRKLKSLTSIVVITALVVSSSVPYISVEAASYENTGEEIIDEVVEELIVEDQGLEDMEDIVYDDLEMLDSLGLDVEAIVDTTIDDEETIVYDLKLTETIIDQITVERIDGAILMNAVEGNKENELLIRDDGTVYLDGKKIIIEQDDFEDVGYLKEDSSDTDIVQSTGGWHWYESGKAPGNVKKAKYKPYPTSPTSKCSNIQLHTAIRNVAIGVLISLLVTYLTGGSGAITLAGTKKDTISGIVTAFVLRDPNTKNMSAKYYISNCKNNNRYRRKKCYIYPKKNYKGEKSVTIEYGVMM